MTIRKTEHTNCDTYEGKRAELLAAGIVHSDQIPLSGTNAVSFLNGKPVRGRCTVDENYVRVQRLINDCIRVRIGVPNIVARERRAAERAIAAETRAQHQMAQAAMKRQELTRRSEIAQRQLAKFIRSEDEYRQYLARGIRELVKIRLDMEKEPTMHAFSLDAEIVEEMLLSCDAIVEVLMAVTVRFDSARHHELLSGLQREIAAATPYAQVQVAHLCRPNLAILEGEAV